jgi:hypothetical protein
LFKAWESLDPVNDALGLDDQKQEWIYKRPGEKTRHLYFEDGLLTEIKN